MLGQLLSDPYIDLLLLLTLLGGLGWLLKNVAIPALDARLRKPLDVAEAHDAEAIDDVHDEMRGEVIELRRRLTNDEERYDEGLRELRRREEDEPK